MHNDPIPVKELISRYLDGTLSSEDADRLLTALHQDEETGKLLQLNILVDAWLDTLSGMDNEFSIRETPEITQLLLKYKMPTQNELILKTYGNEFEFPETHNPQLNTVLVCPEPVDIPTGSSFFKRNKSGKKLPVEKKPFWKWELRIPILIPVVIIALLVPVILLLFWQSNRVQHENFQSVATIVELVDVVWQSEHKAFKREQEIGPTQLFIRSGMVKLVFKSGATLVCEGPGEYTINTESNLFCSSGRINAHIPQEAIGFEVATPFGRVIDRGTEFLLNVDENEAKVGVVKGKVDLISTGSSLLNLVEGIAFRFESELPPQKIKLDTSRYVSEKKFQTKLNEYTQKRKEEKKEFDLQVDLSPDLLARFDFSSLQGDRALNRSQTGKSLVQEGLLYKTISCPGDAYGEKSIGIQKQGARIETDIPGSYTNITLMANIRIDRFREECNVLFSSESPLKTAGGIVWQILPTGEVQLQIRRDERNVDFFTTTSLPSRKVRDWSSIAVVINGTRRTVSLWYDGKMIKKDSWDNPIPLVFGKSIIGNIAQDNLAETNRYLNGRIQDFALYKNAVTPRNKQNMTENKGTNK